MTPGRFAKPAGRLAFGGPSGLTVHCRSLYARTWTPEQQREKSAFGTWNLHYNYHRPHGAHNGKPPAPATPSRVNNVLASYN